MHAGDGPGAGSTRSVVDKGWLELSAAFNRLATGYGLTERERKERVEDVRRVRERLTLALDREAVFVSVLINVYLFFCTMEEMTAEAVGQTKGRLLKSLGSVVSVEVPIAYEASVAVLRGFVESVAKGQCSCPVVAGCTLVDPKCDATEARSIVQDDALSGVELLANLRSAEEARRNHARNAARYGHTLKEAIKRIDRARVLAADHPSGALTCPCGRRFREIWECLTAAGVLTVDSPAGDEMEVGV